MHIQNPSVARVAAALLFALSAVAVPALVTPAHAAAPLRGEQAPGYYRIMIGDIEVTALSDGTIDFPMDTLLTGERPEQIRAAFGKAFQRLPAESSMNQFLVNTGGRLVLVDAGAGTFFGPTLGRTLASLRAAGYTPEQVDDVVITHMHLDHTGGLVHDGERSFPNATVHIARAEHDFWMQPANASKVPEGVRQSFAVAREALQPYSDAGKLVTFDGEAVIAPGVRAIRLPGHTVGHTGYAIESRGETLLAWGDVVHAAAIQFADPSVRIVWDSDGQAARRERDAVLAQAAKEGFIVAGAHLPFPGLGHVTRAADGKGYVFVPVTYTVNRTPASVPNHPG